MIVLAERKREITNIYIYMQKRPIKIKAVQRRRENKGVNTTQEITSTYYPPDFTQIDCFRVHMHTQYAKRINEIFSPVYLLQVADGAMIIFYAS